MEADSETTYVEHPVPQDFDNYFPYACKTLQIPGIVTITRQLQSEYISAAIMGTGRKSKLKPKSKSGVEISSFLGKASEADPRSIFSKYSFGTINILAYYDNNENLVHLRFYRSKDIPCTMFKLLALIVQFYGNLNRITIDRGLHKHNLEELNEFLLLSNVTDVCLDDTKIYTGGYHILLENKKLRQLSLCRCNINDSVIEKIASRLEYPENCSKTLSTLNLATNRITDKGAKHLATALRSNRHLSYLNLSDNMITEEGGMSILNSLSEFLLTTDEVLNSKRRFFMHLKQKMRLVAKFLGEMKSPSASFIKTNKKKKPAADTKVKVDEDTASTKRDDVADDAKILYELATEKANKELGDFIDAFSNKNTIIKNEFRHCLGNTKLCYLNLSYNNLSLPFVNKLIKVLKHQKSIEKRYTGLLYVKLEGNCLPKSCAELQCASELLQAAAASISVDKNKHSSRK